MKKAALGFIALAMSLMTTTAQAYGDNGDICSINRCDQNGKLLSPMEDGEYAIAGETVYFRIRFLNVHGEEAALRNRWQLNNIYGDANAKATVGVYVSGQFREAEVVSVRVPDTVDVTESGSTFSEWLAYYTDVVCAYKVQPGDFAFPMTLAFSSRNEANDQGVESYWLNPDFELRAKVYTNAENYSWVKANLKFAPEGHSIIPQREYKNWSRDLDMRISKINVKTLDFVESTISMDEGDPRLVDIKFHGGTNSMGGTVYLKVKDGSGFDLVKSGSASVYKKSMKGPDGVAVYQCLKVEIPSGVSSFQVKVLGTENGKSSTLYLSSTELFVDAPDGMHSVNYITTDVTCGPPKRKVTIEINPADITLTNGTASAKVSPSPDYATALRRLTVKLSTAFTGDVEVKIVPSMVSAASSADPWNYISLSQYATDGYLDRIDTVKFFVDEMNRGVLSKDVYVYVKGGDQNTAETGNGIRFLPEVGSANGADSYYNEAPIGSVLTIEKSVPQIEEPVQEEFYEHIPGGVEYPFAIKINDSYNDVQGAYVIEWKKNLNDKDNASVTYENPFGEDAKSGKLESGYLFVSVKYNAGDYTSRFRVKNSSGGYSEWRTIKVQVDPAKQAYAEVDGFASGTSLISVNEIDEEGRNTQLSINVCLNAPHEDDLYAFLVPLSAAASNNVTCTAFVDPMPIPGGETVSVVPAYMDLLDGSSDTSYLRYAIVLRTGETLDSDPFEGTYECKELRLSVKNVAPVIGAVGMSGSLDLEENGGTFGGKASVGLQKVFTLDAIDSRYDWTNTAYAVWTFSNPDGFTGKPLEYKGPLNAVTVTNTFTVAGVYDCNVKVQDKDMLTGRTYSEVFKFKVVVGDQPAVQIVFPESDVYDEDAKRDAYFNLVLSAPATTTLVVNVECQRVGSSGLLTLATNSVSFKLGETVKKVAFSELDGTPESASYNGGFTLTAEVVTTELNDDGQPYSEAYLKAVESVYVSNVAPVIEMPIETGSTNMAAINVEIQHPWRIWDIDSDRTNDLEVTWITSEGGAPYTVKGSDVYEGVFTNVFKSGGSKVVTITVTDKDGTPTSANYYYYVSPSKAVYAHPYGPYRSGPLTSVSKLYADADGLGAGRLWSEEGTAFVSDFAHKYTFGESATSAKISAWGYKNGQVDDGNLPKYDIAISKSGDSFARGADVSGCYVYSDREGRDSFFYAWVIATKEEDATVYTGSPLIAPLRPTGGDTFSTYKLTLPTEQEGDGATPVYSDRYIEAFFSKELFAADNMGDMNADGIPDYFATKLWSKPTGEMMSIAEAMTGQAISGSGSEGDSEGASTASDLTKVQHYNDDGDFLPAACSASNPLKPQNCSWAPDKPFTAEREIRGFGTGLNEPGVSDYELTEAETNALFAAAALAGTPAADYSAATNWAADAGWTPEAIDPRSGARLNPIAADTDGDGFDDGWEYYFWYYAKIGAVTNGVWGRLEGRRYSPAAPATGVRIAPEEIVAAFDPHTARNIDGVDFDNDGLSDLEEFVLGTNPCDWDSDGDGASDLWELLMGLDPCSGDGFDNPDCDFMARSEYADDTFTLYTFADGKVFALPTATDSAIVPGEAQSTSACHKVQIAGVEAAYYFSQIPATYTIDGVQYLAKDESAFATLDIAGAPFLGESVLFAAGTKIESVDADTVDMVSAVLPETGFEWIDPATGDKASTAKALEVFNYGGDGVTFVPCTSNAVSYTEIPAGVAVVKVQSAMKLTLIHNQVMVQYGFDPRVAWNIDKNGFLDNRWRRADSEDEGNYGFAGVPTSTVEFTSRDEYLVMQYRMKALGVAGGVSADLSSLVANTTFPNLPLGFVREKEYAHTPFAATNKVYMAYWDNLSKASQVHGADTDSDGIPDGWELYVNSNPVSDLDGALHSHDSDLLSLAQEYAGVDSCNAYTNRFDKSGNLVYPEVQSITQNHPGKVDGWWNKFFPSNPYSVDTDGDGLKDHEERDSRSGIFPVGRNEYRGVTLTFIYGDNAEKYAADGTTVCFRGGGLNPCTVDTDGDLLPDAWEYEFAGVVFANGGTKVALSDADLLTLVQADEHQNGIDTNAVAQIRGGMDGTYSGDANYDFDHDGLLNCQEYLVQSLRHLRYDDAITPLMGVDPVERKFLCFLPFSAWDGNAFHNKCKEKKFTGLGTWKFRDLGYFALPPHSWDMVACNVAGLASCANYAHSEGAGYRVMLRPSVQVPLLGKIQASGYASTDPRRWDTDNDGMDDYYEIFHGLNPLLGSAANPGERNEQGYHNYETYDVIAKLYTGGIVNAWQNHWAGWELEQPAFDAIKHPWMIGTMECDADGDGLRNDEESLKVNVANPKNTHTDPTPLWMTDSTSAKFASFTSQYYSPDPYLSETPLYNEMSTYHDLFYYPWKDLRWNTVVFAPGSGGINRDWMFSFEENEGFDTDGDFKRDTTELVKGVEPTTDPLNFNDPNRRQALYLPGSNSAAISYDSEARRSIGTEPDLLKQFTVECWVRPDIEQSNVVILERVCVYGASTLSNNQQVIRANFRVGTDANGCVYGMFEGTTANSGSIRVTGNKLEAGVWTHVAFTFNGSTAALYVNGAFSPVDFVNGAGLMPANGIDGILQESGSSVMPYTGYRALPCANIIGASARTADAVSVNPETTWADFTSFYQGWIDEVRVWDGARTPAEIHENYLKRYSFDEVAALRETVYKSWRNGATRASADSKLALPAELLLHYNFASLPGGVDAVNVMRAPTGFEAAVLDNVRRSNGRDLDDALDIGWWSSLALVNSKVYSNYAVVPWIHNTVAHLPLMDGSSVDSQYWNSYAAGLIGNFDTGYAYPNSANPYSGYVHRFEKLHHLNRLAVAATLQSVSDDPNHSRYSFQLRSDFVGTTDLVPLGGAFAKRGTDFWDAQGAMDAWTTTSADGTAADKNENGIPDWAEDLGYKTADAYVRALAEGLLPSGAINPAYADTADSNNDGLYDWWQNSHDLKGKAKSDTDKDGLADFAEYLVSDVFKFGEISPVLAKSNGKEFDYFRKAGKLYLGELFSDHDFMEDEWENLFANSVADSAIYDPSADSDGDGWSNYAECRAGTLPNRTASIVIGADELADYPTPVIRVKAAYSKAASVNAPIVVKAYSDTSAVDAQWVVPGASTPVDCERAIGLNPGKKMVLDLGPGVVVPGTTKVMMRDTQEFDSTGVWQDPSASVWREVLVETVIPGNSDAGNISKIREPVGTIHYPTAQAEIDFTALQGYVYYNVEAGVYSFAPPSTNAYMRLDMQNSYVKICWQSMRVPSESSWSFSLSKPVQGHVREGLNTFVAFVDLNGDGKYTIGEPMGVTRNVNVGWNSADVEIEILENGMRFDLGFDSDETSVVRETRVKVTRKKVNNMEKNAYGNVIERTILDFSIGNRAELNDADFMKGDELDIDWSRFPSEVLNSSMVLTPKMNVTSVTYRVEITSSAAIISNSFEITRTFSPNRILANPCDAYAVNYSSRPVFKWTIPEAAETFTAFAVRIKDSNNKVVWNSGYNKMPSKSVSGEYEWRATLSVNDLASAGNVFENAENYTWQVALHNSRYQSQSETDWSTPQKFRMNVYAKDEINGTSYGAINASVKYFGPGVFSTDVSSMTGIIRVEAYTTPDFTGVPAARGFIRDYASVTNDSHEANVTIVGLEAGTYYLRAFIDSDGDNKRSDWESWGYVCPRGDIVSGGIFNPVGIKIGAGAAPVEVCYIEDTDLDQDCLPDVYEYDSAPSNNKTAGTFLAVKGVADNAHNGYISVNPELQTAIDNLIGAGNNIGLLSLGGQIPMQVAALSLGMPTLENSIEESTLAIKSIALEGGAVNLTVAAEANEPSLGTVFVSNGKVTTTIVISYADSLNGDWKEKEFEKTFEIADGNVDGVLTITREELMKEGLDTSRGFFKVSLK